MNDDTDLKDCVETLASIASQMSEILARFRRSDSGVLIAGGDQAAFTGLVLEAREIFSEALGPINSFGLELESTRNAGTLNFLQSQSYSSVEQAIQIVETASRIIQRKTNKSAEIRNNQIGRKKDPYIAGDRITELRNIRTSDWDLRRLVRICEEINDCFERENYLATAMLVRTLKNHIPPIFRARTFVEFANSQEKSIKILFLQLENSLKNIADTHLHQQIREREILPTATQVDFRQSIDALLGEIIRNLR